MFNGYYTVFKTTDIQKFTSENLKPIQCSTMQNENVKQKNF